MDYLSSTRFRVTLLLSLCNAICYADRINIAIASVEMAKVFGWNELQKSLVLSSFFVGYLVTQMPAAWFARKYGADITLIISVGIWSLATLFTPFAAHGPPLLLYVTRIVMGLGEGMSQVTIHCLVSAWVPPQERSRALALASGGGFVGTVLAASCAPLAAWWWPSIFYSFGIMGLVWVVVALRYLTDGPESHRRIDPTERAFLAKHVGPAIISPGGDGSSIKRARPRLPGTVALLLSRPFIAIYTAHFCHNWAWYILISWVPTYVKALGVTDDMLFLYNVLPFTVVFFSDLAWASYADGLIERGTSVRNARVLSAAVSTIGPSVPLLVLALGNVSASGHAMLLLCAAVGMSGCAHSAYWANIIDVSPAHAGELLGLSNTIATVPGIIGNLYVGWVLSSTEGSWPLVWLSAVAGYLIGFAVFRSLCSGEVIW